MMGTIGFALLIIAAFWLMIGLLVGARDWKFDGRMIFWITVLGIILVVFEAAAIPT